MSGPRASPRLPLIQYWHEKRPPEYIVELLDTFAKHNPEMDHMVFDRETARDLIETHYGRRSVDAFDVCLVPAIQADFFRYCAVHALGGLYADADCRCLRSLLPLLGERELGVLFRTKRLIVNGVFAFRSPGHPLLEIARQVTTRVIEQREGGKETALATGPGIFTYLYWHYRATHEESAGTFLREQLEKRPDDIRRLHSATVAAVGPDPDLAVAFDAVRIARVPSLVGWLDHGAGDDLPYKRTAEHWAHPEAIPYTDPRCSR